METLTKPFEFSRTVGPADTSDLRAYVTELTKQIVATRTVNYNPADFGGSGPDEMESPGCETRVTTILKGELAAAGIEFMTHGKDPKRENLLATVGRGEPGYRKLLLLLHTDTVPSGDPLQWTRPPFEPYEKEGWLYGRGVLDNKGPLAASFAAFLRLKAVEHEIPGQVVFGAVADEEVNTGYGLPYLTENGLLDATDALIPDIAGEMREIDVAEKGCFHVRVTCLGKAAHAMEPEKGVNAITSLSRFIAAVMGEMKLEHEVHPVLGSPTLKLGLVRGGSAPNAVAAEANCLFDIRFVPGMTAAGVERQFAEFAERAKLEGTTFKIEVRTRARPTEVSRDAAILKVLAKHAPEAKPIGIGGGTFCKELILRGIEAVGWAPGDGQYFHMIDERIEVAQLVTFAERLVEVARDVASQRV